MFQVEIDVKISVIFLKIVWLDKLRKQDNKNFININILIFFCEILLMFAKQISCMISFYLPVFFLSLVRFKKIKFDYSKFYFSTCYLVIEEYLKSLNKIKTNKRNKMILLTIRNQRTQWHSSTVNFLKR